MMLDGWATPQVGRGGVPGALEHLQWLLQLSSTAGGVLPPIAEGPQGLRGGGPGMGGKAAWHDAPGDECPQLPGQQNKGLLGKRRARGCLQRGVVAKGELHWMQPVEQALPPRAGRQERQQLEWMMAGG